MLLSLELLFLLGVQEQDNVMKVSNEAEFPPLPSPGNN